MLKVTSDCHWPSIMSHYFLLSNNLNLKPIPTLATCGRYKSATHLQSSAITKLWICRVTEEAFRWTVRAPLIVKTLPPAVPQIERLWPPGQNACVISFCSTLGNNKCVISICDKIWMKKALAAGFSSLFLPFYVIRHRSLPSVFPPTVHDDMHQSGWHLKWSEAYGRIRTVDRLFASRVL